MSQQQAGWAPNLGAKTGGISSTPRENTFLSWKMNKSAGNLLKQLEGKRGGDSIGYGQFDDDQRGDIPGVELKEFAGEDYNPEACELEEF